MNAQVIFYSALAFLLELVASIPYAADLQRYSSQHQERSSLDSNSQTHQYQNLGYQNVYNNPAPQLKDQELPNFFARNQQRYLNKGPPQIQPEISNERYINQQRLPNQYYANWKEANQQTNNNQHVIVPEVSPEKRNTQYRTYPQQVVNNNRFQETVKSELKELSRLAEEPQSSRPNQLPPRKLYTNILPFEDKPQLQIPPKLIEESFAPSIPSVPTRNINPSKDALTRVNDYYLQIDPVKEHPIPVLPPPPNHIESGIPLSASERYLARAGNPVEQIPEPQVQPKPNPQYNSEHYFTDPRIQNVLSSTKHKKRYLVIHPNGVIEHVDNLEAVAKKHPHYVLVHAGDIVPHAGKNNSPEKAPVVQPPLTPVQETNKTINENAVPVNNKTIPSLTFKPSSFELEVIVKPPTHGSETVLAATPAPMESTSAPTPVLPAPVKTANTTVSTPVVSAAQAVAIASTPNATAIASAPPAVAIAPATTAPIPVSPAPVKTANTTVSIPVASAVQAEAISSTPNASAIASAPNATAIASAPPAVAIASATAVPTPQIPPTLPTPQAISTNATPVLTAHTPAPQVATKAPTPKAQNATSVPLPQTTPPAALETGTTAPSPSTPKEIQPSKIEIDKEVLPPHLHNDTDIAVKQPLNVPKTTSAVAAASSAQKAIERNSAPPTVLPAAENPPQTTPQHIPASNNSQPLTPNVVSGTTTSVPVTESTPHSKTTVAVVEIVDKPQEATTPDKSTNAPLVVPVLSNTDDKSLKSIDQFMLEKDNANPNPAEKVPDLGGSNVVANAHQNPVVWFRTSDPNIWDKITDKSTGFDVVYFFQVQNQPKIVRDTKTTIFPNGTVLEEFTETAYQFEGDDPKVTKTTKLTDPKNL